MREKVCHVWLLDPLRQSLEVLQLEGSSWSLIATHEGSPRVRAAPFDAIEVELGALWHDAQA
jgi:hypothetical protein